MRDSSNRTIFYVFAALMLGLVLLYAFQGVWLKMIQYMLVNAGNASSFPTAESFTSDSSFAESSAPVSPGVEATVGDLGITVTRVLSPANYVGGTTNFSAINMDEEYLAVDISVRCRSSADGACHVSEFDFGVEANSGRDYSSDLSGSGSFEGGEIQPGDSRSGSLTFVIKKGESGLTLYYPRMFAFGGGAKFILTK